MTNLQKNRGPGRPPASNIEVPTSEQILNIASRLFMDVGYDAVSMGQVANACGVTKAMVYYYFSSKANLFIEAMVQTMETIRQRTLSILNREEPLYDRLLKIMRTRLKIDTPLDFNAIMRSSKSGLTNEQIETMRQAEARLFQTISDAFQAAIDEGAVRGINPDLAAHVYMALLNVGKDYQNGKQREESSDGTKIDASAPNDAWNVDDYAEQLLQMMWNGVAADTP